MASFDFTALIKFLAALFETFAALLEKLGFNIDLGGDDEDESTTAAAE